MTDFIDFDKTINQFHFGLVKIYQNSNSTIEDFICLINEIDKFAMKIIPDHQFSTSQISQVLQLRADVRHAMLNKFKYYFCILFRDTSEIYTKYKQYIESDWKVSTLSINHCIETYRNKRMRFYLKSNLRSKL